MPEDDIFKLTPKQVAQIDRMMTYGPKEGSEVGNPNYYLGIDPGETTGYALAGENGMITDMGNVYGSITGFNKWVWKLNPIPKVIVLERYIIDPKKGHGGTEAVTIQVIGAVKNYALCPAIDAKLHLHMNGIKSSAEKYSGIKPVGNHIKSHPIDGLNHLWLYLTEERIVTPRILWPS